MAPLLLRRDDNDTNTTENFHLLPLLKTIPSIAWLLIKMALWFLCFLAFLGATFYAIYRVCKLVWHSRWYYGEARRWFAARRERGGGTELEALDGDGEGDGGVDGETLYGGEEEGKGVV